MRLTPNPRFQHTGFTLLGAVLLALALSAVALLGARLAPARAYRPAFILDDEALEQVNMSAFAVIAGELRASMADVMWVKTERYLHRGVAFTPHINADELAHTGEVKNIDHDNHDCSEHGEHKEKTLVPGHAQDYRGFIGALQRNIQPWQGPDAPHEHTAGEELLPWYRMMTYSNPHHWRAYMTGAWWLGKQAEKTPGAFEQAVTFIEEGIRNNPENFQLRLMRGRLCMQAEEYDNAIDHFHAAGELALKVRPEGGDMTSPLWTESDEEDFGAALRFPIMILWRKLGRPAEALDATQAALALLPADQSLKHMESAIAGELIGGAL